MAFRQIGNVLAGLVADPEKMRAALNEPARELETPDQTSREATVDRAPAQDEPAHLLDSVRGLTPTSKGKYGKMASTEAPAKFHGKRQTEERPENGAVSASPNTMSGSITVAHRRRRKEVPASGAAVIDLGMERAKRRHLRGAPVKHWNVNAI